MSANEIGRGNNADLLSHALETFDRGEIDVARVQCEQILQVEPAHPVALMLLGLITKKNLQIETAIPLLERSVRIQPNPAALMGLADCLWRVGRLDEALLRVEQLALEHSGNLETMLLKVAILHGLRRFDAALDCARLAEKLAPDSYLVAARLGCILAATGDYEKAELYFHAAGRTVPGFRHCGLINFRQTAWRKISSPDGNPRADEFVSLRAPDIHQPYDTVVMASCDAQYFHKYGVTFVNSYAQNAANRKLLHLHVLDPEDGFADHLDKVVTRVGLRNIVATYEFAPVDEEPDFNLRRTFYSCARFLRMGALLRRYQRPVACFDIDTVFEAPLDELIGAAGGADIGLVHREPPDSPWLDIVANIVIANNTEDAQRYLSAVENFIRHFVVRGKLYWHLDQIALYCVLKMMERFDSAPRVAPIAAIASGAVWHIGNPYEYRRKEHRVARYQLPEYPVPAALS